MTVGEIIAMLQQFPLTLRVVVDGSLGGVGEPRPPAVVNVKLNVKDPSHGPHAIVDDGLGDEDAVYIQRP
jgi:hypothetical protein